MASRLPSSFLSVRPSRFTVAVEPLCTVRPLTPRHTPTLTRTNASQAHTSTCTTLKHRNDYSLRSFHTHHRHSADAQTTPTDAPNSTASTEVEVTRRPSKERGRGPLPWLNGYHTFSFESYRDIRYQRFFSLRVINEDRVACERGFETHPHKEFEIWSYILSGVLTHRDSMGNTEDLPRGSVQLTSAGTGITHSEMNHSQIEPVHLLQVWIKNSQLGLEPCYQTKVWSDEEKLNQLRLMLSEDGREGSLTIRQDVSIYGSILEPRRCVEYQLQPDRAVYVHLAQDACGFEEERNDASIMIETIDSNGAIASTTRLENGDGAFIRHRTNNQKGEKAQTIRIVGTGTEQNNAAGEFILIDVQVR